MNLPNRRRLSVVVTAAGIAALGGAIGVLGHGSPAGAAEPGTPPVGPLTMTPTSGDATTPFELDPVGGNTADPANAYCPGDSATDGYRWQTYITPAAVDPATLTYNAEGPVVPAAQSSLQAQTWPLFSPTGTSYVAQNTSVDPKGFFDPAGMPFAFNTYPNDLLPSGDFLLGVACSKAGVTETYWTLKITLTADAANGYTISESVGSAPAAPVAEAPTAGDGSLTVAFAVTPTPIPPVTEYQITATPGGGGAPIVQTVAASPATIAGLTNGVEYSLTITATNAVGTSPASSPVVGTPAAVTDPGSSTSTSSTSSSTSTSSSIVIPTSSSSSSSSSTVTPPSASSSSTTVAASGALPRTGGGSPWPIGIAAVIVLALGRIIVLLSRTPKILPPRP